MKIDKALMRIYRCPSCGRNPQRWEEGDAYLVGCCRHLFRGGVDAASTGWNRSAWRRMLPSMRKVLNISGYTQDGVPRWLESR